MCVFLTHFLALTLLHDLIDRGKEQDLSLKASTYDLSFEDVQYLFYKLEVINHCEDVILQYQNERQD